ncbi:MAG: N-acetyltransferase [Proteobacteria bacterium]|nr:MAG: N-acetyltransferase [Pseudomonadota bacterium]
MAVTEVILKPVDVADTPWIQQYASDPRISATCNVPSPYPENGAKAFVQSAIQGREARTHYVFCVYAAGEFAGLMTLNSVDHANHSASLDYWIAVPFWGRGIGTAAAKQMVAYAFDVLKMSRLHSGCLASNPASGRVLSKAGFVEEGSMTHDGVGDGRFQGERIRLFQRTDSNRIAFC